jgi:hypothetical protein
MERLMAHIEEIKKNYKGKPYLTNTDCDVLLRARDTLNQIIQVPNL